MFDSNFIAILEAIPESMVVADQNGKVVLANTLTEKLFNYTKIELLDLYIEDFMPTHLREPHRLHRKKYLQNPFIKPMSVGAITLNINGVKKNLEEFPIDISLSPVEIDGTLFILVGMRDLTERKIYEEDLKEKTESIAKQAALIHFTQQQTQEREEFVDHVCHEIRNPLQGIIGGTELLQESLLSLQEIYGTEHPELFERFIMALDIVRKSSKQQKIIVDDVLTISKLENNKLTLNEQCFELISLVQDVIKMFTIQITNKHLTLILDIPQQPIWIKTDPNQLSQVIINLISNAIKFTQDGSITCKIIVDAAFGTTEDIIVNFVIQDTGIGMSREELSKLFQRFSQANHTTSSTYGGSGLGLVISKKVVELMHGEMQVESQKSQGTKFCFFIKGKCVTEEELRIISTSKLLTCQSTTQIPKLHNKQILIVEDNKINITILIEMLKKTDCIYLIATTGLDALSLFDQHRFDLIFMDLELPDMHGTEITEQIREKELLLHYHTPIICMSGHTRQTIRERALNHGMDDYLSKPFVQKQVFALLLKHIHDKEHHSKMVRSSNSDDLIKHEQQQSSSKPLTFTPSFAAFHSSDFLFTPRNSPKHHQPPKPVSAEKNPIASKLKQTSISVLPATTTETKTTEPKRTFLHNKKCIIS